MLRYLHITISLPLLLVVSLQCYGRTPYAAAGCSTGEILVVGSMNADTILSVDRLPVEGENLCVIPKTNPIVDIPGGKGCNQAIACARLLHSAGSDLDGTDKLGRKGSDKKKENGSNRVSFLGQFGNDQVAQKLEETLVENGVDVSSCGRCKDSPSGRGYVFLQQRTGKVSAVVSGGSNVAGWDEEGGGTGMESVVLAKQRSIIMLQREIPEHVNLNVARIAKKGDNGDGKRPIVIQDVGGEDRPMTSEMMSLCDYLVPNRSELARLVSWFKKAHNSDDAHDMSPAEDSGDDDETIVKCAKLLQAHGANNVLITLGDEGSILISSDGQTILRQSACALPDGTTVVDETGAGDCFRAAFAVAISEGKKSLEECMRFASAAGCLSVTRQGAVPSTPRRGEVDRLFHEQFGGSADLTHLRGGGDDSTEDDDAEECPLMFGSRLNSMKDRPELWNGSQDAQGWVKRQGTIEGLGCVDFNYPQHFHSMTNAQAKAALDDAGLVAGAVCLRYPHDKFQQGAMTHPDAQVRKEAIELTMQAAQTARDLNADEVVVWSAYDGYDYPFQVDYDDKWNQIVEAFQQCCDAYPDIKFSLEFKPTDENTRFFAVPSTGAAMLLVHEIDRPNMGLTLDVGHMLMAGENPGQSIAMVGDKLFGVQLNDGYTRLAAEDGMMFGSVHPMMALEAMYYLQRINFSGHLYFDTFPQRTDPVREAEYNIKRVKEFWRAARYLHTELGAKQQNVMRTHDALGALELTDEALAYARERRP